MSIIEVGFDEPAATPLAPGRCRDCAGTGKFTYRTWTPDNSAPTQYGTCGRCKGTGEFTKRAPRKACSSCGGEGTFSGENCDTTCRACGGSGDADHYL